MGAAANLLFFLAGDGPAALQQSLATGLKRPGLRPVLSQGSQNHRKIIPMLARFLGVPHAALRPATCAHENGPFLPVRRGVS